MHLLLVFFNGFESLLLESFALFMICGELSHPVFMLAHPLEQLLEVFVISFSQPSHITLRPFKQFLILFSQIIADLFLNLVKLLLLLFDYLLLLYLFLYALLHAYTFDFLLMVLYLGINTLHLSVDLLDNWVYLFNLLLEGIGLGLEMLESRFR